MKGIIYDVIWQSPPELFILLLTFFQFFFLPYNDLFSNF